MSRTKAILIAHRDERLSEQVTDILLAEGCSVALASNGHDAVSKLLARQFDAMLVDLFLPKLDGPGVLQRVRMLGQTTPVLLVGKPLGATMRKLEEARAMGSCRVADSKDPAELARLVLQVLSNPEGLAEKADGAISQPHAARQTSKASPRGLKRKHHRAPIQEVVHYQTAVDMYAGRASDVSAGGMFIESESPLDVGTPLMLKFALPGRIDPLLVPGEVVRVQKTSQPSSRSGMGVRFAGIDEAVRQSLEGFVRAAAEWDRSSPSGSEKDVPSGAGSPLVEPGPPGVEKTPGPKSVGDHPAAETGLFLLGFPSHEAFLAEYDANISHDVLFVPTEEKMERGTWLTAEIQLPGCPERVIVQGRVVCPVPADPARSIRAGLAVHLDPRSWKETRALREFANRCRGARPS